MQGSATQHEDCLKSMILNTQPKKQWEKFQIIKTFRFWLVTLKLQSIMKHSMLIATTLVVYMQMLRI